MKILVTGANGNLGSHVLKKLLETTLPSDIAISVRDVDKAKWLKEKGVDVRHGDFDYPDTLKTAFSGIDRLLIISSDGDNETRIKRHLAAVNAAKEANVKFIAYTSVINAENSSLSLAVVHNKTEEAIIKSKIPYSFLRNNWYLENEISSIQGVLGGAPLITSSKNGKVGWLPRQDYAEAAAKVISEVGHENTVYELSGIPKSYDELASVLGNLTGKNVPVQHVDDNTYKNIMKDFGLSDFLIDFIVDIQKSIRNNSLDFKSDDFEKLLGRKPTSLKDGLTKILSDINNLNK